MLARLERTVKDARNIIRATTTGENDLIDRCDGVVHDWRGLSIDDQRTRNFERLDRLVVPFKTLRESPGTPGGRTSRPLIFMHIPKSGGTTLEYLISKNYMVNGVIHINAPALERNPRALYKRGDFPHVVIGHHKLNQVLYQFVDHQFAHITMLREPVGRVLSYFNYLQTSPNHGLHEKASQMTLEQFVDDDDMVELHNAQTLRLAGLLKRRIVRKRPNDSATLELAKQNLTDRFSMFGLVDRYAEFLLMCRRLLGWQDIFYQRRNVSKRHTSREEVAESTVAIIRRRNALDTELYDRATELFDERCLALGITDETVGRYKELNDHYVATVNTTL